MFAQSTHAAALAHSGTLLEPPVAYKPRLSRATVLSLCIVHEEMEAVQESLDFAWDLIAAAMFVLPLSRIPFTQVPLQ